MYATRIAAGIIAGFIAASFRAGCEYRRAFCDGYVRIRLGIPPGLSQLLIKAVTGKVRSVTQAPPGDGRETFSMGPEQLKDTQHRDQ
jgi:hypothetical protein